MLKQPTDGGASVTSRAKLEDLRSEACEFIVKRASILPVIVIGGDSLAGRLRSRLDDIKVYTVKTEKEVTLIKSIQETISKGVILLHESLSYGTDVRPLVQPECVVISKEIPCYYDFM